MEAFGAELARACTDGAQIWLIGNLGAGKTTLVRGFLRGLGHQGPVRSPTYTLVEPYQPGERRVFHLDLYRLAEPEELEWLGVRELDDPQVLCLVEWPERGEGYLPDPDFAIHLFPEDGGRRVELEARSVRGEVWLRKLAPG
jgi:tRNA threonylcarbamoyladenosine biosynthesis protein TsaE